MKKILIIGTILGIILVGRLVITPKYVKIIDENGDEFKLKEGDTITIDAGKIEIMDIQFDKLVVNKDGRFEEYKYNIGYEIYAPDIKFDNGDWISGGVAPVDTIFFEKIIF